MPLAAIFFLPRVQAECQENREIIFSVLHKGSVYLRRADFPDPGIQRIQSHHQIMVLFFRQFGGLLRCPGPGQLSVFKPFI